jgi:hypothetical protein
MKTDYDILGDGWQAGIFDNCPRAKKDIIDNGK